VANAIGGMDRTTGDDLNAHFEAITFAMTGEQPRLDNAVTHLREWRDYYARIHASSSIANSSRCGSALSCVPNDQYDVATAPGQPATTWKPGTSGLRAADPLPVGLRPVTDFLWQRPPTQLDGSSDPTYEPAGIDYLTPYWMVRYHTEVAPPALAPFPAALAPSWR
jgi:hypothetical protein